MVTNTHSESAVIPAQLDPRPASQSSTVAAAAETIGQRNVRAGRRVDARRQAISGPMPTSRSSGNPNMTRKKL